MADSARGFPVTLESWGWSQKGDMRPENQDSFLSWNERLLWAVADGVGSSAHGGEAGRLVTRMLLTTPHAASLDEHVNNVSGILRQGNGMLRARGGAAQASSTVVALLMHGGEAACLWAGDSRCYLLRDGVLYQCTREHTLRQEKIDNGELTAPEARRMVRGNIITNAVGARDALRLRPVRRDGDQFARHQPDADVGRHAQKHRHSRQRKPQKGQALMAARVVEQHRDVALFSLSHEKPSSD